MEKAKAFRICWQLTTNGSHTFRERLPTYLYLRREPRPPRAESFKLRSSPERTLLALVAPGCPHGAAAGVHAVPAGDLRRALLVLVPQVATLQANVCGAIEQHVEKEKRKFSSLQRIFSPKSLHRTVCSMFLWIRRSMPSSLHNS